MTIPRRTILFALGLAPATMVGAETFAEPARSEFPGDHMVRAVAGAVNDERIAKALEQMAGEIRAGRIMTERLTLTAEIESNNIMDRHTMLIEFIHQPERNQS